MSAPRVLVLLCAVATLCLGCWSGSALGYSAEINELNQAKCIFKHSCMLSPAGVVSLVTPTVGDDIQMCVPGGPGGGGLVACSCYSVMLDLKRRCRDA